MLWKDDRLKIKQLGFNAVRTWVEWSVAEPEEGKYHLENFDLLLRLANEVGLNAIVLVYVDSAREWVGESYPDTGLNLKTEVPAESMQVCRSEF